MMQIIIKLIEFFLNPGLIPTQRDLMHPKIFLMLTQSRFENIKPVSHVSADAGGGSKIMEKMLTSYFNAP